MTEEKLDAGYWASMTKLARESVCVGVLAKEGLECMSLCGVKSWICRYFGICG